MMGKDIKLICSAYGFPSPRLYLKKEVSSKVDEIVNSLENITYSVSNIQPSDAGKFICLAENIAGRVKKEETVTVSCKFNFCVFLQISQRILNKRIENW